MLWVLVLRRVRTLLVRARGVLVRVQWKLAIWCICGFHHWGHNTLPLAFVVWWLLRDGFPLSCLVWVPLLIFLIVSSSSDFWGSRQLVGRATHDRCIYWLVTSASGVANRYLLMCIPLSLRHTTFLKFTEIAIEVLATLVHCGVDETTWIFVALMGVLMEICILVHYKWRVLLVVIGLL